METCQIQTTESPANLALIESNNFDMLTDV